MAEEKPEPEIKVTDRRRFSAEGEALDTEETPELPEASETPDVTTSPSVESEPRERPPLPPATFEFLVISLRWQAEMQLGIYGAEVEGQPPRDLEGARHSIDLLGMLQEKTKGNLRLDEQRLLENTLTEMRFRYIQAVEAATKR
jgi:hypothetical protein